MEKEPEPEVIVLDPTQWRVPQYCQEGWDSCPHVAQKQKKTKTKNDLKCFFVKIRERNAGF